MGFAKHNTEQKHTNKSHDIIIPKEGKQVLSF